MKGRLFICADAGVNTGFATVTHNLIKQLYKEWEIHVLAVNYNGDPHPIQEFAFLYHPMAKQFGDYYGMGRINELMQRVKPDVSLFINDPWVLKEYIANTDNTPGKKVFYTPIDAENVAQPYIKALNAFDYGVAYTQFGAGIISDGGFEKPLTVIPHGIDFTYFYPIDKPKALAAGGFDPNLFVVQVVDRNSVRKRIDLAMQGFADWVHATDKPDNVKFYYHGALQDEGYDIEQLAAYLGIADRLMLTGKNLNPAEGVPIHYMTYIYNLAQIKVSTSGAEGWGLTAMESMATRTANMVVDYAAYGEWARGGVHYIRPADIPFYTTNRLNTKHVQADITDYVRGLEMLYTNEGYRNEIAQAGYDLVHRPEYEWSNIAARFDTVFNEAINNGKGNRNSDPKND